MKFKFAIFAFVFAFLLASVSAANVTISSTGPGNVLHNAGSFQLVFNVSYNWTQSPIPVSISSISSNGTVTVSSYPLSSSSLSIAQNQSNTTTLTVYFPPYKYGTISGVFTANDSGVLVNQPFSVYINNTPGMVLTSSGTLSASSNSTINVTNTGNTPLSNIILSGSASFSPSTISSIAAGSSQLVTVYNPVFSSSSVGTAGISVSASATDSVTGATITNSTTSNGLKSFCTNGNVGHNLTITSIDIRNSGKDDTTWMPLDTITIDAEVSNDGDARISSVYVELALLQVGSSNRNRVGDLNFISSDEQKINLGSINDGSSEKAKFEFTVPSDFDTGSYKVAIKTYSNSIGQSKECTDSSSDNYQSVEVERESDKGKFIGFDNIVVDPSPAACNDNVAVNFKVLNVGDEDQDRVKVRLINKELGLDYSTELTSGLDMGDTAQVNTEFAIPANAKNKTYSIALTAEYDYKDGVYRESLDTEKEFLLRVIGCTSGVSTISTISSGDASSDSSAPREVSSVVTIKNTGSDEATYAVDAKDYTSWADLKSISSRVITLGAGQSKAITFTFAPKSGVSGSQTFTVQTQSNGVLDSKQMSVMVESSFWDNFRGSAMLWVIGIVNVILIILIIVVVIRIARR